MRTLAWITAALLLALPACVSEPQEVARSTEAPAIPEASESEALPTADETQAEPLASASPSPAADQPAAEDPPTSTANAAPPEGRDVELWFIREVSSRLYVEPELHRLPESTPAIARATMELLVSEQPDDPALFSGIPEGTRVLDVSLKDRTLTVDFDFPNDHVGKGSSSEAATYHQITHTGAQFDTVDRVRILEEGGPPSSGHFANLDRPRRPNEDSVSSVIVLEPVHRQVVSPGRVRVRGTANVYEATVELRLVNPSGKTVRRTFTTATCGTGCRGDWEHTFAKVTKPGTWKIVAAASDPSDGDGNPPYTTKRRFVIR